MEKHQVIDYDSKTANFQGCEPCPRCRSEARYIVRDVESYTNIMIKCRECGHQEVGSSVEGRPLPGEIVRRVRRR